MYRTGQFGLEVLLVHPGGPLWKNKDDGAWSIPKGEFRDTEEALQAAQREFTEELGRSVEGSFVELAPIRQAGGKTVYTWAVESDFDPAGFRSNTFAMEWPPRSGRCEEFPEIDRAEWFTVDIARRKLLKAQVALLDELLMRSTRDVEAQRPTRP